ncbi:arginase [Roseovarius rhodophyticola]|uniref:Arginase n=1 Tax=Roseovarius rhodophyticola TaxID=3080827 RepID=A0ABZ2TEN0_9RHOB|nr:arginase [Roseovarius sp. W115]MDV2928395.1 arginase [Roseovarius sp. W115]
MKKNSCILVGAPVDSGKKRAGCLMGPDAYRVAGLTTALEDLDLDVQDWGNVAAEPADVPASLPQHIFEPALTIGWTTALIDATERAMAEGLPVFLGGDHSLSLGTVVGAANHAAKTGKPQFVLWLDAHTDFHTPQTTASGNMHGTPLGYASGREGFGGFPEVRNPVPFGNICFLGLRSVDPDERLFLQDTDALCHDMRTIDEKGIARPLAAFLDDVARAGGALHVSLDVDFLDPTYAPAVGTTVPGGATIREAHLVMEMICDSGLMTSLDLVELNPHLDERGRTAQVMVDLAASALGRRVFDRPTGVF